MVARRQTDLGTLFQEALRAHIGESRYQMWFGSGVRFAFEGNALTALVDTPFMVDWLKDGYARVFAQVGKDLFGQEITVNVVQSESSLNNAPSKRSSNRANPSNLIEPEDGVAAASPVPETSSAPAPQPPKRKRGRPRKNASAAQPVAPEQPSSAPAPEPPFFGAYDPLTEAQPEPAAPPQPVKRKRGRPRKNPLPETVPSETSASFQPQTAAPLSAFNPPESFLDEFNETATLRFPQRQTRQTSNAFPNLSDSERVAWVVGDFDDSEVASAANDVVERKPGKRGRPKGSTNRVRRAAQANDAPLFPVRQPEQAPRALFETRPEPLSKPTASTESSDFSEEEEIVSRNARGANFVTRPKGTPRVQAVSDRTTQFATLDTFVPGYSNRLALSVAGVAISEPAAMNPIFFFGNTSVGKTHLLEGICDAYTRVPGRKPPLYMTGEQFTSAFIQSMRGGRAFRDRFKNISLLALDDLHFLEGKLATETEFLNVVDYLRVRRVQLVFTANRPLVELTKLRGELIARIESGFIGEIKNPERETLLQILHQMARERKIFVPDDVCRYVVSRFATHARQLSGALNRLLAAHLTTGSPIDLELARDALADLAAVNYRNVKLEDVERVVQSVFGLDSNTLKSSSRAKKCADPRAIAMWLARKHTRSALAEIGNFFGGRKHSAVLSAQKKVDEWIRTNETIDAGESVITVPEIVKRLEVALAYPRQ